MGKRIRVQRRGKGGSQYRSPPKAWMRQVSYPSLGMVPTTYGRVDDILHDRGRSAPLMKVMYGGEGATYLPAVQGLAVGQQIAMGEGASVAPGNILPLERIPEGTSVCNIELVPMGGGKLVRASGGYATIRAKTPAGVVVRLPSRGDVTLSGSCRATVGVVAGGGRLEKPFLKAGTRFYQMKARGKVYPVVRAVAMTSVYSPYGGGRHQHAGKPTSVARTAPPGRKSGDIAPRKTGRKRISRRALVKK